MAVTSINGTLLALALPTCHLHAGTVSKGLAALAPASNDIVTCPDPGEKLVAQARRRIVFPRSDVNNKIRTNGRKIEHQSRIIAAASIRKEDEH